MNNIVDFFMDPLRLTLIIAGVVVLLAIIIFGRKSNKRKDLIYSNLSSKEFSFGNVADDQLLDEDIIVKPKKKKAQTDFVEKSVEDTGGVVQKKHVVESPVTSQHTTPFSASNENQVKPDKPKKPVPKSSRKIVIDDYASYDDDPFADSLLHKPEVPQVSKPAKSAVSKSKTDVSEVRVESVSPKKPDIEVKDIPPETPAEKPKEKPVQAEAQVTPKPEPEVVTHAENKKSEVKQQRTAKPAKERFVVLHVVSTEGEPFTGKDIIESAQTLGLAFGKHAVFHYPVSSAESGNSKFCLVNMTAQGNFDSEDLPSLTTNGISLIMRLPLKSGDALTVFSNMLGVAQVLVRKLGGEILDQTRVPLTADIVTSLRADIAQFESGENLSFEPEV